MSDNFKAIVIDNQNEKFTREIKEIDKSFNVTKVAFNSFGKLIIIKSISINIPCYT